MFNKQRSKASVLRKRIPAGLPPYARRDCIFIIRIVNWGRQSHRLNEAIKCSLWGPRPAPYDFCLPPLNLSLYPL